MFKLFLFVAFLAFAAAAPGALLSPIAAPAVYTSGYAAPYAYSAYPAASSYAYNYNLNGIGPYPYRAPTFYTL